MSIVEVGTVAVPVVLPLAAGVWRLLAPRWRAERKRQQAVQQAILDVPVVRRDLDAHRSEDAEHFRNIEARFNAQDEMLKKIDRNLDLARNDIGWLKGNASGKDDDR
jgi:hypothetical protein